MKPDFIVEAETSHGRSAALWATILQQVNPNGRVITINIEAKKLPILRQYHSRPDGSDIFSLLTGGDEEDTNATVDSGPNSPDQFPQLPNLKFDWYRERSHSQKPLPTHAARSPMKSDYPTGFTFAELAHFAHDGAEIISGEL